MKKIKIYTTTFIPQDLQRISEAANTVLPKPKMKKLTKTDKKYLRNEYNS